jgi:hypothetical protein
MKKANLQSLSETELTELRRVIGSVLLGLTAEQTSEVSDFYDCLSRSLEYFNGQSQPSLVELKGKSPELYEGVVAVNNFINKNTGSVYPDEDGKKEARHLYVRLITAYLDMLSRPITLKNVLALCEMFPCLMSHARDDFGLDTPHLCRPAPWELWDKE